MRIFDESLSSFLFKALSDVTLARFVMWDIILTFLSNVLAFFTSFRCKSSFYLRITWADATILDKKA